MKRKGIRYRVTQGEGCRTFSGSPTLDILAYLHSLRKDKAGPIPVQSIRPHRGQGSGFGFRFCGIPARKKFRFLLGFDWAAASGSEPVETCDQPGTKIPVLRYNLAGSPFRTGPGLPTTSEPKFCCWCWVAIVPKFRIGALNIRPYFGNQNSVIPTRLASKFRFLAANQGFSLGGNMLRWLIRNFLAKFFSRPKSV